MDPPAVDRKPYLGECALPGEHVRIDGVDERAVEIEDQRPPRTFQAGDVTASNGAQQPPLEHEREEEIAIAVTVDQHRPLVAVVSLNGALTPASARPSPTHRERLDRPRPRAPSRGARRRERRPPPPRSAR